MHKWSVRTPGERPTPEGQGRGSTGFGARHGACDKHLVLRFALTALVLTSVSACLISTDDFGIRHCKTADDCPGVAGYICAAGTVWPQRGCGDGGETCVCEVRFPPEPGGIQTDGGTPPVPDAGPPPDYCTEIRPILQLSCLGTCHGTQMGYPNSPSDFRLDYWEPGTAQRTADGGPGVPGVKDKISRIKARIYDEPTMPPQDFPIPPTDAQRKLVNRWVTKFGAPLGEGSCELYDAGAPQTDGGTTDGGARDGGVDAGAPVSFATDILPIFTNNCGPCHTTNTSGGLSLTAANAYNALVNANVSAGCATGPQKRVLANAPQQSQLWLKTGDDPNKCNMFMPRGAAQPLKTSQPAAFDRIERWIRQGAQNN